MRPKTDTILIIEDDLGLIELINEKIQECGHPTICFQTAATAFEWLENNTPILMMLDYSLPDMNAKEFIGLLNEKIKTISPFIVATGQGDERIAVEMMKLGAKEYIIKDTHFLEMIPFVVSKCISEIEKDNKLRLTEQKIVELNQFNKQIIESAHEGIVVYDKELNYLTWNPFMEKITGFSAVDVINKNALELFPFLQKSGEAENIRRAIEEKKITENEFEFNIPSTGKFGWVSQTSGPLFNFEGEVIGAIATVHDLTKRKKAEEVLELTKQSYVDIINSVSEAIYILDENATFTDVNEGASKMYQMSNEELIGKTPADVAAPGLNNLNEIEKQLKSAFKTGKPTTFEFWAVRKNGEIFPKEVIVNKGQYFKKDVLVAAARDITERKAAQHEIDKIGRHYQALIENAPDGIVLISAEGQFKYASPSARRIFGYTATEELIENPNEQVHPEDLDKVILNLSKLFEDPTFIPTIEYRFIDKAGNWKWVETTFTNLLSDPNVSSIVLNFRDITERKNAETAIKQSEEKYRTITENISDVVWTTDEELNVTFISSSVNKLLLETPEEHMLRAPHEKFTPSSLELVLDKFNLELENEKNPTIEKDRIHILEVEHYKADGSIFWAEMRMSFLRDEATNVKGLLGVTRDISERKIAELQINKLNDCFLTFGSKPKENIDQLVKVCGELFNSTCAMYNHLQDGELRVFGSWNVPEHFELDVHAEGNICAKVIKEKSDNVQNFKNLKNSEFAVTDSNILKLGIDTYIGKSVKFGENNTGSLCVLFKNDFSPSNNEIHLLEIIASAIGVEEERMQVQKVLEVSEEKYRTIIEYSNDWIWMLDKNGCFTFINKTTENATELNAKDWIGRSFTPLAMEEDLPVLTDIFQRSMNGEVCTYELRFRKTDSSILTILVNTSPICVQGEIIGMISFGQDITERKRAEKALIDSEMLYRNLVQRIPDGVYKSTPDGKFVDINPAIVKMLGYESKEELLNIDIKKELYFEESHRDSEVLNPNNEEKATFQLRKKDGSAIWVEDHGWYNFNESGQKISNEGVLRDITERKKAEEVLTEKMDELMRFHRLMVGRELTMIGLKKEVNNLLTKIGEVEKYKIVE
jgi:PAS domain S-box-containing protein